VAQKTRRGAAPGAPKPKIEPRKTPLMRRTWFRRTAVAVLALVLLWVGLFTWGRVSRASTLRSYEKKLFNAARLFFKDIETAPTSMQQTVADFIDGKVTAKQLGDAAATWEEDFTSAHSKVSTLKPPSELTEAQKTFLSALEDYIGVVRFYVVVKLQDDLVNEVPKSQKKLRTDADNQLKLLEQHVQAASTRADTLYTRAIGAITSLAKKWGVKSTASFPAAPGQIPPSTGQGDFTGITP